MNNKIIIIEGPIGAGKSTLIKNLCANYPKVFYPMLEDLNQFENFGGDNLLKLFYEREETKFLFQAFVLASFTANYKEIQKKLENSPGGERKIILCERSAACSISVFGRQNLKPVELRVLRYLYHHLVPRELKEADLCLYLGCSAKTSSARAELRQRESEKSVSNQYFQKNCQLYQDWINSECPGIETVRGIKEINADLPAKSVLKDCIEILKEEYQEIL